MQLLEPWRPVPSSVDAHVSVQTEPLAAQLVRFLGPQRNAGIVAGPMGLVALALASVDTFGVVAYLVTLRRRDVGVRIALGASSPNVTRAVVATVARPVGGGLAAGLLLSALARSRSAVSFPASVRWILWRMSAPLWPRF